MIDEKIKKEIDNMSQFEMCRLWRFHKTGDHKQYLFDGEVGEYYAKVLKEKGGFTPAISKELGWES